MRLFGSEVLIENCEVKGIQGAVSIEENAKAEIRSGKFYTVNTSGQQDAFYALYVRQQRRSHDHGRRIFRSQRQDGIADRRYQCGRIRRQ